MARTKGNKSTIQNTVLYILNNFGKVNPEELSKVTIEKLDKMLSLVSCNLKLSSDSKNFDSNEFRIDKSKVFNYKMKYTSTGQISKDDMIQLNLLFQKHKNIAKILLSK